MAELVIAGHDGSVTFASGYVANAHQWAARVGGTIIDTTPFTPTSDYRTRATGALQRWAGSYKCKQTITAATNIAGPAYIAFPVAYTLNLECEALDSTKFTDTAVTYIAGLLTANGTYDTYVGDTTALPAAATTATGVFTVDTGKSWSIPLIIGDEITVTIAADGSSRIATIPWQSTGVVTPTGVVPTIAATGAATFVSYTGRQYSGTILITRITFSARADRSEGEYTIEFVGSGACTPA